jgi:hypothetical protein
MDINHLSPLLMISIVILHFEKKSKALDKFKIFKAEVENQYNFKIKVAR